VASIADDCQSGKILSMYSHDNRVSSLEWRFNCYGFVSHLLAQHHPKAYEAVVAFMHSNQDQIPVSFDQIPCPFHYSAFFTSLADHKNSHWTAVKGIEDLQSGDLIVYLPQNYTPKEITEIPNKRTGTHIMIVEKVKSQEPNKITLTVIDCTRFRHCSEDSRIKGGIGRSPVTFEIHNDQTILQWGAREKIWEKELFFGRLVHF
jgi:hypothetical protein